MLNGINHLTVAVKDLERSFDFYVSLLGMKPVVKWKNGAYLTVGGVWYCLSCDESNPGNDYSHISFGISESDFLAFTEKLLHAGISTWKENSSEGNSLYILDPDGHKLEVHSVDLDSRLKQLKVKPYEGVEWY